MWLKFQKAFVCFMSSVMMGNNFQEYDYGMEYLLLIYNKPFHFCSKNTYMTFLLISFQNKGHVDMNQTINSH